MSDTVERFKARRALYGEFTQSPIHPDVLESPPSAIDREELLSSVALQLDDPRQLLQMDPDTLLGEIREGLKEKHFEALVESCKRECLQAVLRPFGIARVLFNDKRGGNVDTVHNVRNGVYSTDYEKQQYNERGDYDDYAHHSDKRYIQANSETSEKFKKGELVDSYSNATLTDKNLDHVKSAKEIHDDPGRVLAEINGVELSTMKENLKPTSEVLNKSKKQKTAEQFISYVDKRITELPQEIAALEAKTELSQKEMAKLERKKKQLSEFQGLDKGKLRAADKAARSAIDAKINWTYYTSDKFITNTALTSLNEGKKWAPSRPSAC